jgi:HK97 family phage major capsid protein
VSEAAWKYADQAKTILDTAELEGREPTPQERGRFEELIAKAREARKGEKASNDVRAFERSIGGHGPAIAGGATGGSPGARFVQSDAYKQIANSTRGQSWSTGAVEVGSIAQAKGTLLEGTGSPGIGTGGGLVPVPDVTPGIVDQLLTSPLGVADLFGQRQVPAGNTVRYTVEGTATSAATGVAEGAVKPESTIALSTVDESVKKIATTITVSDELVDDAAAAAQFVNAELSRFIRIEEERQLLRGGGTNELEGIVGRSGVNTDSVAGDANGVVGLARVIANTRGSSFVEPDAVVLNPADWLDLRLLRDGAGGTIGAFFGAGPFGAGAQNAGASGLFEQSLWGKVVVLSDQIGAGTAIVGNYGQAAQIARRGGLSVEATNSHGELFVQDLVTFRAEQREALQVFRPAAFTVVSGL